MQLISTILNKIAPTSIFGLAALLFVSCGAHQESDFRDADGIYSNGQQAIAETTEDTSKDTYYKQYFNSKTGSYDDLPEEGAIFTDIEAYRTTDSMNREGEIVTEEVDQINYGGWGENSGQVVVNVYDNGFNNGFNNGFIGGGFWNRPFWWYGAGWGFNNFWGGPFNGIGWGWGYPFYGNFGWGLPLYNGGFYNNFHNPFYGNAQHGYAFTRGRRNSDFNRGRMSSRDRNYNGIRSNRQIAERNRTGYSNNRVASRSRTNTSRNNSSRYNQNSRGTQSRFNSNRTRTNNTRTVRPYTQSRNNARSGNNSSRSRSNSTRSSRGGSRSSGMRGGSRGGGSRGGGTRGGGGRGRGGF